MIINGKAIAGDIIERLKSLPKPGKFLGAVLVGGDPALMSFLKIKQKTAQALGVDFRIYEFPEDISKDALRKEVLAIANHKTCGGVIVELPLPKHIDAQYVLNAIPPEKDPDVLSERALGAFYAGRGKVLPLSVAVVGSLLSIYPLSLADASVAVVGAGFLIGKPVASWLMGKAQSISILDKGSDLSELKDADLVICGTGVSGLVKTDMLKEGAGVIDFGYALHDGKPMGDFDISSLAAHASPLTPSFYTPTPGGTGPILVAKLFENFYALNGGL